MAIIIDHQRRFKHDIYTVNFHGTEIVITVTAAASIVRRWLSSILYFRRYYVHTNRLVVGLGVQWTPGGKDPPADTLQLCIGRKCLIFQLTRADSVPKKLKQFLRNPDHTFVGFWNHSDRRKLEESNHFLEMYKNPLDLRLYVETDDDDDDDDDDDQDLVRASVEEIVERCLGYKVHRRRDISTSDWGEEYLSQEQVVYACVDAHCAFLIGKDIRAWEYNK